MNDCTNVVNLHSTNKVLEKLDEKISEAINEIAREHRVTAVEVAGVMRAIEIRLLVRFADTE